MYFDIFVRKHTYSYRLVTDCDQTLPKKHDMLEVRFCLLHGVRWDFHPIFTQILYDHIRVSDDLYVAKLFISKIISNSYARC